MDENIYMLPDGEIRRRLGQKNKASAIDGAFDIATRLYDSNGYPCRTFFFQQNVFGIPPGFSTELFFQILTSEGIL